MPVFTTSIAISTKGERDTKNLTHAVANAVQESGLYNGIATKDSDYVHNKRWGDMNGFSHVRAAMLGLSVTIPFAEGRLLLGTWQ